MDRSNLNGLEQALYDKLEEIDSNVLDLNAGRKKPVFTVTIEGNDVPNDVLEACRKFGYEYVVETKNSKFTEEYPNATTIIFYY